MTQRFLYIPKCGRYVVMINFFRCCADGFPISNAFRTDKLLETWAWLDTISMDFADMQQWLQEKESRIRCPKKDDSK